jgi:antitoxin ParD1/3/4
MRPAEKLSITLPADMARRVRAKVKEGSYGSSSEVIRDALRLWEEREAERERRLAGVRAKIDEAVNDPRRLSEEEADAHFDDLHQRTVKAHRHGA